MIRRLPPVGGPGRPVREPVTRAANYLTDGPPLRPTLINLRFPYHRVFGGSLTISLPAGSRQACQAVRAITPMHRVVIMASSAGR